MSPANTSSRSTTRPARDVLCDRTLFVLDNQRYADFLRLLDDPAPPSDALRKLLHGKAPEPS